MQRFLVVANQTLAGPHLLEEVRRRVAEGSCTFHVLVPASDPRDHATWTEGHAQAVARARLDAALDRFRELGAPVTGEVGDARPFDAIRDVLRRDRFDGIILSTLPPGPSRWLGQDLPARIRRAFDLPLTHLVGDLEHVT